MKWLALLLLSACGHSAQPAFYTLTSREGRTRPDVAGVLELRTPKLAGYLDRHELVQKVSSEQLALAQGAEWAEPLAGMLARVLAADLAQRLPAAQVTVDSGHARAEARLRIDLDVRRFERNADGQLVLDAQVAVRPASGAPTVQTFVLQRASHGGSPRDLVRGLSELLAELAERISALLPA
jgi:uncharacterized lipoprotein YmbA